jgi:hypothetical protein
MMQPAQDRLGNHSVITRNLMSGRPSNRQDRGSIGNPWSQTRVRSTLVVVSHPLVDRVAVALLAASLILLIRFRLNSA